RATPLPVRQHDLAPAESELQSLLGMSRAPVTDLATWMRNAAAIAAATLGHLPAEDLDAAWIAPAWIDYAAQPEPVRAVLDLYAAAATRDAAGMLSLGERLLQRPEALPLELQEQALVLAQLGALGSGRAGEVERLHQGYGVALPHSSALRMVRHMIRIRALEQARRGEDTQGVVPPR